LSPWVTAISLQVPVLATVVISYLFRPGALATNTFFH